MKNYLISVTQSTILTVEANCEEDAIAEAYRICHADCADTVDADVISMEDI